MIIIDKKEAEMKINSQEQFTVAIDELIQKGINKPKGNAWVKINNTIVENSHFKLNDNQLNALDGIRFKNSTNETGKIINDIIRSQLQKNHPLSLIKKVKIETDSIKVTHREAPFSEKANQWLNEAKYHNAESLISLIEALKNPGNRLTEDQIENLRLLKLANNSTHMIALYNQAIFLAINTHEAKLPSPVPQQTPFRIDFEPKNIQLLEGISKDGNGQASYTLGMGYCTHIDMTTLKPSENDRKKGISFLTKSVLQGYPHALDDLMHYLPENFSFLADKGVLSYWGLGKILQANGYPDAAELVFAEGKAKGSFYCAFEGKNGKNVPTHLNLLISNKYSSDTQVRRQTLKSLLKNVNEEKYANDPETNFRLYLASKPSAYSLFQNTSKPEYLLQAALQGHLEALTVIVQQPGSLPSKDFEVNKKTILDFMQKNPAAKGQCEVILAILHKETSPKEAKQYFELAASRGHPVARILCHLVYDDSTFTPAELAESVKCGFIPIYGNDLLEKLIINLKNEHLDEALLCVTHLQSMRASTRMITSGNLCAEKTDQDTLRKGLAFYQKALESLKSQGRFYSNSLYSAKTPQSRARVASNLRINNAEQLAVIRKIKELKERIQ